ncbi:bifunctional adenosylcobinamide kinase/adenosylcobinamide-phosphate guanylyltransferase [Celeribacter sp.]|uniref:bifunctional adenosylcobinamide kinase/adenosylcobinamide-phosphate guanylyltransferase n=1 Tax=Celeribacter sp. TaxID=1890673 RepID=UPI003A8DF7DA
MGFTIMCTNMTVVLGGASSGKSKISEKICIISKLDRFYLASAECFDEEMRTKAAQHRTSRGEDWCTIEEPLAADRVISELKEGQILLFDCATMWLSNHLFAESDLAAETETLLAAIRACPAKIVIVSNETGLGIVPENALARRFRIAQGELNQRLAAEAGTVIGVIAGLPFALKGQLPEGFT